MKLPVFKMISITDSEGKVYDFILEHKTFQSGNDGFSAMSKLGPTAKEFQLSVNITRIARCKNCGKSRGSHPWMQGSRGCDSFDEVPAEYASNL